MGKRGYFWLFVCLPLLAVCATWAGEDPWNRRYCCGCWCGSFEAVGEFLWLQPRACEQAFVIDDRRPFDEGNLFGAAALPAGTAHTCSLGYKPGFRVGIGYLFECRRTDFELAFTGLWASRDRCTVPSLSGGYWATLAHPRYLRYRLNPPLNVGGTTLGVPAVARARSRIGYEVLTADFGRRVALRCGVWARLGVGGLWVRIRDRRDLTYVGTAAISTLGTTSLQEQHHVVHERSEGEAVGPRFVGDLRYALRCGLGLSASVGTGVLAGQRKVRFFQHSIGRTVPESSSLDFDEEMRVYLRRSCFGIPFLSMRLGINYLRCCGRCFSLLLSASYEGDTYVGALPRLEFDDQAGTNREWCHNFGVSGLVLSAKVMI